MGEGGEPPSLSVKLGGNKKIERMINNGEESLLQ